MDEVGINSFHATARFYEANMISMHEPVVVHSNRFGAPGRFFWRGRVYTIDAIDRIWRRSHGPLQKRRVYKIRSRGQTFLLHFDQRLERWTLVRAPWRTRLALATKRMVTRLISH